MSKWESQLEVMYGVPRTGAGFSGLSGLGPFCFEYKRMALALKVPAEKPVGCGFF